MAKAKLSLEEGLDRSANKRHLTGKERHRYIGGALHNMGKSKPRSGGKSKPTPHKAASTTHKPAPSVSAPKKQAYSSPTLTKREHLSLVVRKNTDESKKKPYDVYSIYKSGSKTPYSTQLFRKMSAAKAEAKIEMDAHNDVRGQHVRGRLS